MEANRKYISHSDGVKMNGYYSPLRAVMDDLEALVAANKTATKPGMKAAGDKLATIVDTLFRCFVKKAPPALPLQIAASDFRKSESETLVGNIADSYDRCGKTGGLPGTPKLRRCIRCKTARYCSPESQVEAWTKGGHKRMCYNGNNLASVDPSKGLVG
jgi:hypothetical protein